MAEAETKQTRNLRKERQGEVVSKSGDKSVVVLVERRSQHPVYGKTVTNAKKYHVHDEKNDAKVGDTVRIAECRPLSRLKRWRMVEIVARSKERNETVTA